MLDQQIDIAEKENYLKTLSTNVLGNGAKTEGEPETRTLVVDPTSGQTHEVDPRKPVIIQMGTQSPATSLNDKITELLVTDLIAKRNSSNGSDKKENTTDMLLMAMFNDMLERSRQPPPQQQSSGNSLLSTLQQLAEHEELKATFRKLFGVPDQPAVNSQSSPVNQPLFQLKDSSGNPLTLDLSSFMTLTSFTNEQRRKEETHQQVSGFLGSLRENMPKLASAVSEWASSKTTNVKSEVVPKVEQPRFAEAECEGCKGKLQIPAGAKSITCPKCQKVNDVKWEN